MGNTQSKELAMNSLPNSVESLYYTLQEIVEAYLLSRNVQFYKCLPVTTCGDDSCEKKYEIMVREQDAKYGNKWKYMCVSLSSSPAISLCVSIKKTKKEELTYVNMILQNKCDFLAKMPNILEELVVGDEDVGEDVGDKDIEKDEDNEKDKNKNGYNTENSSGIVSRL